MKTYLRSSAAVLGLSLTVMACTTTAGPPPPPPPLAPMPVTTDVFAVCDNDFQIYFASDQTALDDVAKAVVANIAEQVKVCQPAALEIEGHTDPIGPADVNLRVAQRRAEAVHAALMEADLDVARIEIIAAGKEEARTEDNLIVPMNRRVVVRLID